MTSPIPLKRLLTEGLPRQLRQWLWERKVAWGNHRIQEVGRHLSRQVHEALQQDFVLFERIQTKAEWERFRDTRIEALRRSLRVNRVNSGSPQSVATRTLKRDEYEVDNMVFQGHRNLPITANLYRPTQTIQNSPGLVICHSHHDPKTEEELQCMGMTWAKQGCTVLIMDLLGHGERRQHPFVSQEDYPKLFRVDRQDYYFRSVLGLQLDLIGESLMGWMVHDVKCGVDLLWAHPQIDRDRIIVIGAVAGGGDIAAVAGALDDRVAAVVAFNVGEVSIDNWDSTRNLPDTARDGFWPWVILGSLAPRRLVYGKEFSWNSQRDNVWQTLRKVYDLYERREALRSISGSGRVSGHGPLDSHCQNIGPLHRGQLYPILHEWFGIPVPEREVTTPFHKKELLCGPQEAQQMFNTHSVHEITRDMCRQQLTAASRVRESQDPKRHVENLQQELLETLGPLTPRLSHRIRAQRKGIARSEYVVLELEKNILIRVQLLWPSGSSHSKRPVVIGFAQEGNRQLRQAYRGLIQRLRGQGVVVCLAELRGVGDGRHGELYRGRISPSAGVAMTSLMLGESLLGSRIRDLRTVIAYLCLRENLDSKRIALWGDSLAAPNALGDNLVVPQDTDAYPLRGEPFGGVTALLTALFEPHVCAVYIRGGLLSYASLLDGSFVYQPVDANIRGILKTADLPTIAAAVVPRPLRMEGLVDGGNRRVGQRQLEEAYHFVHATYAKGGALHSLSFEGEMSSIDNMCEWFLSNL